LAYLNSDITIVVTVTDTNGCSNTASSPIDVVNVPNLALDGNDPFAICKGSSLTLTVQGANTYRWSNGSQNNSITVSPLSSSTYSVIGVTDPLCPDTLTTEVTVHEPLLDGTTTESVACEPQVSLSGNIPEGGSGYWQTLTGAGVILQPDQAMTLAEDLSIGDNIFQWIVSNPPCPEIDTHRIVVHLSAQLPVAAPDDTIIIVDEAVRIQVLLNDSIAHLPGYTLEWKEKDENGVWELSPSGIVTFTPSASFTGMAHAVYVLCNKDCQEYCSEATITLVYRRPKDDIGQTQVITPNEDGKNDGLIFDYLDQYPKNSIVIFNRWGQRVYEAAPYNNDLPWEGTYKGKPLPAGTYYYILNLRGSDDAVWGNVLILR
jgi:gliding motility-associated-like protein